MIPAVLVLEKKRKANDLDRMRARYFLTLLQLAYKAQDREALIGYLDRIERVMEARAAA